MPAVEKKSDNIVAFPTKSEMKLEYHPTIHDMPSEERPREPDHLDLAPFKDAQSYASKIIPVSVIFGV